jgi:hypothetical protein
MTIISDTNMRMILPEDISYRLSEFIAGRQNFPFIRNEELMCIFYLYGKKNGVRYVRECNEVMNLAENTVMNLQRDIETYNDSSKSKMNSQFIYSKFINRQLQVTVEEKKRVSKERILNDPVIISDCFAQHVSYYNQEYFFQLYGPLREYDLINDVRKYLLGRMVMLGFNRKTEQSLPFQNAFIPLCVWIRDHMQIDV